LQQSIQRPAMGRAVAAATLGNAMEFYDFVTFAFFAIQIGQTFFPSGNSDLSLLAALATFGTGFLARPVGAWWLGGFADRHGRKPAMVLSMSLMGLGVAMLVLTPGYAVIGMAAPVSVILARLIQGFALGGEVGSATTYMLEAVPPHRRGFAIAWQGAGQTLSSAIGGLVGLLLTFVLTSEQLSAFGWRIALGLGILIVPVALYVRRTVPETLHLAEDEALAAPATVSGPWKRVVVLGIVMIGAGTISVYIFHYMATFAQDTLGLSERTAMAGTFAGNAVAVGVVLFAGWLGDRIGRKPVMCTGMGLFMLLIVPVYAWLVDTRTAGAFIAANMILSSAYDITNGAVYAAVSESLPRRVRAQAFAMIYTLPVAFLGGTTQFVVKGMLVLTGNPMAIAWYLTCIAAIGLVGMLLMHESAPAALARRTKMPGQ